MSELNTNQLDKQITQLFTICSSQYDGAIHSILFDYAPRNSVPTEDWTGWLIFVTGERSSGQNSTWQTEKRLLCLENALDNMIKKMTPVAPNYTDDQMIEHLVGKGYSVQMKKTSHTTKTVTYDG